MSDDVHFAFWSLEPGLAAVAEADKIEHRFLGGRLRFLVTCQDWQDQRLLTATPCVCGIQGRVQVGNQLDFSECRTSKLRIGIAAEQITTQAQAGPDGAAT